MNKAVRMARVSAKEGFNFFLGRVISTIIMMAGMIVMVRLLTPSQYGLYTFSQDRC